MGKKRPKKPAAPPTQPQPATEECEHDFVVLGQDYGSLSDGQMTDAMAGLNVPARCNKCGLVCLIDDPDGGDW